MEMVTEEKHKEEANISVTTMLPWQQIIIDLNMLCPTDQIISTNEFPAVRCSLGLGPVSLVWLLPAVKPNWKTHHKLSVFDMFYSCPNRTIVAAEDPIEAPQQRYVGQRGCVRLHQVQRCKHI